MALRSNSANFEALFNKASGEIVDFRKQFSDAYEAATTDSARYRLEKHFVQNLPKLYGRVDDVLDRYNEHRARDGL